MNATYKQFNRSFNLGVVILLSQNFYIIASVLVLLRSLIHLLFLWTEFEVNIYNQSCIKNFNQIQKSPIVLLFYSFIIGARNV